MHIPDGFLDPKMSSGLLGAAAAILGYCLAKVMRAVTAVVPQRVLAAVGNSLGNVSMAGRRVLTKVGEEKLLQMGTVASIIFAVQMFNFPVNSGTSGHLVGGVFILRRRRINGSGRKHHQYGGDRIVRKLLYLRRAQDTVQ